MISKLIHKLEELPENKLHQLLIFFCSAVFFGVFVCAYMASNEQITLISQLKKIINSENRINLLLKEKALIDQEKTALGKTVTTEKNLLKVIESSAKEVEVEIGDGVKSTFKQIPIPFEPDFTEEQASISLDKVNLKKIITLINSLRNENFAMFRELKIENKGNSPAFQVLLSMRQNK